MAWSCLSPGPIFKETGFIPLYPPIRRSTTPAQRNTDQSSESNNTEQDYPDSPVSKVYDISNTSSNLIILNNRMKTKSGSHLRGQSSISRCSSPDPQRHRTEHTVHKNTRRHVKCLDSSTPRERHKSALMWHNQSERPARKPQGNSYVDSYRHVSCRVSSDPATLSLEKCKSEKLRNPARTRGSRDSCHQSGGSHLHPNQFYIWSLANIYISRAKPPKHQIDLILRQQNKGHRKQQDHVVNRQSSKAVGGKTRRNPDKKQNKKNTYDRKEGHNEELDKSDLQESSDSSNNSENQTSETMTEEAVRHKRHSQSTQSDLSDDEDKTDSEIDRGRAGKTYTEDEERNRSGDPGRRESKDSSRGTGNEARKKNTQVSSEKRQTKSSSKRRNGKYKSKRSNDTIARRNRNNEDSDSSNQIETKTSVNKQKKSSNEEDSDKETVKSGRDINHSKETSNDSEPNKTTARTSDTDYNTVQSSHESVDASHDTQRNANVSLPSTDDEFANEEYSVNEEEDGLSSDSSTFSNRLVHHREGRLRPKSRLGYRPRKSKNHIAQTEHTQGTGSDAETQIMSDKRGDRKDNPQLRDTVSTPEERQTMRDSETHSTEISKSNQPQSSSNEQVDNSNQDMFHLSDEDDENISDRTWGRMMQQEWRN